MNALFQNTLYNFLLKNGWLSRSSVFDRLWKRATTPVYDVHTKMFGTKVVIPSDYSFPLTVRLIPSFNNPYLELVFQLYKSKSRKLNIIDVGASVGDTFLYIYKNLPAAVNKIVLVEGHDHFYRYLDLNTKQFNEAIRIQKVLSDRTETIRELVITHQSSASSQGTKEILAQPLDEVLATVIDEPIDIIKVDVEGFDGRVLAGARNTLHHYKPHIIFEYHPGLIQQTKNDLLQPFSLLEECGYSILVWFDKTGVFSHTTTVDAKETIKRTADECLDPKNRDNDLHYDIVALPSGSQLNIQALEECQFAKNKKFRY